MISKADKLLGVVMILLPLMAFLVGLDVWASNISGTLSVDLKNTLSGVVEEPMVSPSASQQNVTITPSPSSIPVSIPIPSKTPKPKIIKKTSSKLSGQINNFYVENTEKSKQDMSIMPTIIPRRVQYSVLSTPTPVSQLATSIDGTNNLKGQANILDAIGDKLTYYFGVMRNLLMRALLAIVSFMNITELLSK
jgi:hypothetical protein